MRVSTTSIACIFAALSISDSLAAPTTPLLPCLQAIGGGEIVTQGDKSFATQTLGVNYRFTFQPAALFVPTTVSHIQKAVLCARNAGVPVAPRSGGHSYEGNDQGGASGALMIDLVKFSDVVVDSGTSTAVVGPAIRLAPLYYKLWKAGEYVFPGGTCPTVGMGGLTLGGGFGMLGRNLGLAVDQVISMDVVLADGTATTVSGTANPDLFFALRGAGGGSFGIVTSFKIKLHKVSNKVTSFSYDWPRSKAVQIMTAYNAWGASDPTTKVTTELAWDSDGSIELQGTYLGGKADIPGLLKTLTDAGGAPSDKDVREQTYIDSALRWTWTGETDVSSMADPKPEDARYMKGSSVLYSKPLSKATIAIMQKRLSSKPQGATAAYAIVDMWGGSVSTVSPTSTAFVNRDAMFGIELVVEWGDYQAAPGKPDCAACLAWIKAFLLELVAQHRIEYGSQTVPAYQNYIDKNLPDWQHAYYGENWAKLVAVKAKTDPDNLFRFPQSIPTK